MSTEPLATIAFVGIGNMGAPMAACLVAAGHRVTVIDSRTEVAERFADESGCAWAPDLSAAADGTDVVITILPTSADVVQVVDAALDALADGTLLVEMSSGDPATTRELATRLSGRGIGLIDCPVSGGVARACTGELTIMAGGDDADIDRAGAVLSAMGSSIHRCGSVGSGQAMKALNNLASAGGFLIGVEVLLIGATFGLDPAAMVDILNVSTGMTNSSQRKFAQFVLSRSFDSGFGLDLMAKDLRTAMAVAGTAGVTAPFASMCEQLVGAAAALLGPGQDHTALARFSELVSGSGTVLDARP